MWNVSSGRNCRLLSMRRCYLLKSLQTKPFSFRNTLPKTHADKDWEAQQREEIIKECSFLTRSLFRTCLRSARILRQANEADERDFAEREKRELQQLDDQAKDPRLNFLSMLPPVDRIGELESRYQYYCQYARETFFAESDIFSTPSSPTNYNQTSEPSWDSSDFERYLHYLQNGEKHRKWLLKDMKFDDPYSNRFDKERVKQLQTRASNFFEDLKTRERRHRRERRESSSYENEWEDGSPDEDDENDENDEDVGWGRARSPQDDFNWDSDDDDDEEWDIENKGRRR